MKFALVTAIFTLVVLVSLTTASSDDDTVEVKVVDFKSSGLANDAIQYLRGHNGWGGRWNEHRQPGYNQNYRPLGYEQNNRQPPQQGNQG